MIQAIIKNKVFLLLPIMFLGSVAFAGIGDSYNELNGQKYICQVDQNCDSFLSKTIVGHGPQCVGFYPGTNNYMDCQSTPAADAAKLDYMNAKGFSTGGGHGRPSNGTSPPDEGFTSMSVGAEPEVTGSEGEAPEHLSINKSAQELNNAVEDQCATFDAGIQSCEAEHDSAMSRCDDKNDPDMTGAGQAATMAANAVSGATASSMQFACSKMKDVAMTVQGALAGFKAACESARSSCVSSCGQISNYISSYPQCAASRKPMITKNLGDCKKLDNQLGQINYSLQSMMATHLNAKQCAAMSVADSVDFCKSNPLSPICKNENVDCNDPKMSSTNPVCICMNNPRDPVCGGGSGSSTSAANSYGAGSSGGSGVNGKIAALGSTAGAGGLLGGAGAGSGAFGSGAGGPGDGAAKEASKVGGAEGGGRGAGLAGGGLGNNIGGGNESPSTGKSFAKNGNGAFYGGGGGSSAGGGGSYGGGGSGGSGFYGNQQERNVAGKQEQPVDLRNFLPKSRPNMMLGMTGPDGITGPTSDIWVKINNRYVSIRASMRP